MTALGFASICFGLVIAHALVTSPGLERMIDRAGWWFWGPVVVLFLALILTPDGRPL